MYNLSKNISKAHCYAGFLYCMRPCLSAYGYPIIREVLMNNTNSTNHSKQLRTWAKIINDCKEAKASGTTVKD